MVPPSPLATLSGHKGRATTTKFGTRSGTLVLTGGSDHRVNVWAIGSSSPLLTLHGHTSAISAVAFDQAEEVAIAGSITGVVKLWDLEHGKAVRTFHGHSSQSIIANEFHPSGHYCASAGRDGLAKVWDLRSRACIQTHRSTALPSSILFSPDGRWMFLGSEDGLIKVFDLATGQNLSDLRGHASAVGSLVCHPHEFLLCSAAKDGSIRFWDLENFSSVGEPAGVTTGDTQARLAFTSDGSALLAASIDAIRIMRWEPFCVDFVQPASWLAPQDAHMTSATQKLLVASLVGDTLQLHSWPTQELVKPQPMSDLDVPVQIQSALIDNEQTHITPVKKSIVPKRAPTTNEKDVKMSPQVPNLSRRTSFTSPEKTNDTNEPNTQFNASNLRERVVALRKIKNLWIGGHRGDALRAALACQDPFAVAQDVLNGMLDGSEGWLGDKELYDPLIALISKLLMDNNPPDSRLITALSVLRILVVVYAEENDSRTSVQHLFRAQVEKLKRRPGKIGVLARDVLKRLS